MDDELNITFITLAGYVKVKKYKYLYFFVTLTVFILILIFNLTIVCIIWINKNLHEPMYVFIAALLLNSVFFSTAIYPKLLIDYLSEKQIISYSACLFQLHILYSLGGSEFLLLTGMAYDRYVSICKPLQYHSIMRRRTVVVLLGLAWLLPACQVVAPVIMRSEMKLCHFSINGIFCNNLINNLLCETSKALTIIGVVVLVDIGLLPLLFIFFTYTRIFIVAYKSCKEVRKKATQTCLPHLLVMISVYSFCAYDIIIARVGTDPSVTERLIMALQAVVYQPLFNPIIYGVKMKEISQRLKKLFCQSQNLLK